MAITSALYLNCQQYNTLLVFINGNNHLHYETCAHTILTILLVNKIKNKKKKEKKRRRDTKRRAKTLKSSMSTFFLREGETLRNAKNFKIWCKPTSTKHKHATHTSCISSLEEFHENSTKCHAIFAQSTDFGGTDYSTAMRPYVLQRLRYKDHRKPGRSKTLPKLPQTNNGRFTDKFHAENHGGQGSYPMQSLLAQRRAWNAAKARLPRGRNHLLQWGM